MTRVFVSLLLAFGLVACHAKPEAKPSKFFCITALGVAELSSDDPEVHLEGAKIRVEKETANIYIARSMCAEVVEK